MCQCRKTSFRIKKPKSLKSLIKSFWTLYWIIPNRIDFEIWHSALKISENSEKIGNWYKIQKVEYRAKYNFQLGLIYQLNEVRETPLTSWLLTLGDIVFQNVMLDSLHHGEAIDFLSFASNNEGQLCIRHNESSILWVLQLIGFDVIPEQL